MITYGHDIEGTVAMRFISLIAGGARKHGVLALLIAVFIAGYVSYAPAYNTLYYIDATDGDDSNPGTTTVLPWKTIEKANAAMASGEIGPGDTISLERGETWKNAIIISVSGTPEQPVTFTSYGDPNKPRPVIDGLTNVFDPPYIWKRSSTFSNELQTVWYLQQGYSSEFFPNAAVVDDGVHEGLRRGIGNATVATAVFPNDLDFARVNITPDKGSWTFYVRADNATEGAQGNPDFGSIKFLLSKDTSTLIDTNGHSNLVIENMILRGGLTGNEAGTILLNHSKNVTIRNNEMLYGQIGVLSSYSATYSGNPKECINDSTLCLAETENIYDAISCTIESNDFHDNWHGGVYLRGFSRDNRIINNNIYNNYNLGQISRDIFAIALTGNCNCSFQRPRNLIEKNKIFNNGSNVTDTDSVVSIYSAIETTVRFNEIYNNEQAVFYFAHHSDNSTFSYNLVHNNRIMNGAHLKLQGGDNLSIHNNTIYNNIVEATEPTAYGNSHRLVSIEGNATNSRIHNNLFIENKVVSHTQYPTYLVWLLNNSGLIDNNIYFGNSSTFSNGSTAPLYASGNAGMELSYLSLDEWQFVEFRDLNSKNTDPNFYSPSNSDFSLRPDSPAIDIGSPLGFSIDLKGNQIVGLPDLGSIEFGSRTFAIEEVTDLGSATNDLMSTYISDEIYESLTEDIFGKKTKLTHEWLFNGIPAANNFTFYIKAYRSDNQENDNFKLEVRQPDKKWIDTGITISNSIDNGNYQLGRLPWDTDNTLNFRIIDTDRSRLNTKPDTVYIDHMFIRSH